MATTIGPLVGLTACSVEDEEFELDEGLSIRRNPHIQISEGQTQMIGTAAIERLKKARWSLVHVYEGEPGVHLGEKETASEQRLIEALLSLWISKRTGAALTHFVHYHQERGEDASSLNWFKQHFTPHEDYEHDGFEQPNCNVTMSR